MTRRCIFLLLALATVLGSAASLQAQGTEEIRYYHTDAVGSVRLVTDAGGQVVERYDYLPFGKPWPVTPSGNETRRFAGKERDAESGWDYFGGRYYASGNGRFTTVDPVMNVDAALTDPQRWNRYAYSLNNPLRNVDPDGRDTIDLAIGFGQGIWNTAKSVVTLPYALVTDPVGVASAVGKDLGLLGHGIAHPGEVLDAYISLSVSANDADQRALGAAVGQGTAVAALMLAPTAKGATTQVVHYTDAAGKASIEASGSLRSGTFVTKPSEVRGMSAAQVESRLEIQPGKGAHSVTARVPTKDLAVPTNGPTTSGGAWQRVLKKPIEVEER